MPHVAIIILNWNGWKNTIVCLESLFKISYSNYEIIIVDNGSTDDSVLKIKSWIRKKKKNLKYSRIKTLFILNRKNEGFVGGNNIVLRKIVNRHETDFVLLLNNDTVVSAEFLSELIKTAENNLNVGIVGPKIYYFNFKDKKNVIQSAGAKIDLFTGKFINYGDKQVDKKQFNKIRPVDHICGACLLIKRKVIKEIGLLDERYFAYFDDVDWSLRVKQKGYKILYNPYSYIWHKGGESLSRLPELSEYYNARNVFLIEKKFATPSQFIFFLLYYFLYRFPKRVIYCCLSENKTKMLTGYFKGLKEGIFGR